MQLREKNKNKIKPVQTRKCDSKIEPRSGSDYLEVYYLEVYYLEVYYLVLKADRRQFIQTMVTNDSNLDISIAQKS